MRRASRIAITSALGLGLAAIMAACATENYHYVPAEHRSGSWKEAIYNEPPEAPTGTVRVQYVGFGDYQAVKDGPKVKALHLKLVASNHAQAGNWTVLGQDAFVAFPNGTRAPLLAANPPALDIPPGGMRAMDLYFPLPEKMKSPDEIAEFDFHWQATALGRQINETTAFDRVAPPRYYASNGYYPYGDGWGFYPYGPGYEVGFGWGHPW